MMITGMHNCLSYYRQGFALPILSQNYSRIEHRHGADIIPHILVVYLFIPLISLHFSAK